MQPPTLGFITIAITDSKTAIVCAGVVVVARVRTASSEVCKFSDIYVRACVCVSMYNQLLFSMTAGLAAVPRCPAAASLKPPPTCLSFMTGNQRTSQAARQVADQLASQSRLHIQKYLKFNFHCVLCLHK